MSHACLINLIIYMLNDREIEVRNKKKLMLQIASVNSKEPIFFFSFLQINTLHGFFVVLTSLRLRLQAANTQSLSFAPARKGNAFLRLQPVPLRFAVSCAVSFLSPRTSHLKCCFFPATNLPMYCPLNS
jgi:hypothetical protein